VSGHGRDPEDKNIRVLFASAEDPVYSLGWALTGVYLARTKREKGRKGGREALTWGIMCI
jgi:hypothetical protein